MDCVHYLITNVCKGCMLFTLMDSNALGANWPVELVFVPNLNFSYHEGHYVLKMCKRDACHPG
jgi:hypothetical protein